MNSIWGDFSIPFNVAAVFSSVGGGLLEKNIVKIRL
jgi:uncharacterized protein (DUF2062 family)